METALRLAGGRIIAEFIDRPDDDPGRERRYSEHLSCPNGHPQTLDDIEPRSFSFNSPLGACPVCSGLGTRREIDPDLVVPDGKLPLAKGAVAPWAGWKDREYFGRLLRGAAEARGFSVDTPWDELPAAARDAVLNGTDDQVHVSYRTRAGRDRSYHVRFEGVLPWLERRYAEAESDGERERYEGYMRAVPCPACGGTRLRPEILAVTVHGLLDRGAGRAADPGSVALAADPAAGPARGADRRAAAGRDPGPARVPDGCRAALSVPRPGGGDAGRR